MKNLPVFLREKRESAGLSQNDVAKRLRYGSSQFISNWERGISSPPIKALAALADMYDIKVDELFSHVLEYSLVHLKVSMEKEFRTIRRKRA